MTDEGGQTAVRLTTRPPYENMYPLNQPEVMIANAAEQFDAEGHVRNETTRGLIRQLVQTLVVWTRQLQPY